jgi:hypothetical protein
MDKNEDYRANVQSEPLTEKSHIVYWSYRMESGECASEYSYWAWSEDLNKLAKNLFAETAAGDPDAMKVADSLLAAGNITMGAIVRGVSKISPSAKVRIYRDEKSAVRSAKGRIGDFLKGNETPEQILQLDVNEG